MGRAAIQHYKQLKRYPVFSHDELIIKISGVKNIDVTTAMILRDELSYLISHEKKYRDILQDMVI